MCYVVSAGAALLILQGVGVSAGAAVPSCREGVGVSVSAAVLILQEGVGVVAGAGEA